MRNVFVTCLGLMLTTGVDGVIANAPSSKPSSQFDNDEVLSLPSGLRLKGTCLSRGGSECQFEIIMCSQGRYYYRKEWSGDKDTGHWTITLIVDDFHGVWGESWGMMGGRGGGNAGSGGKDVPEVCRRVWSSPQKLHQEYIHYVEEFAQLTKHRGLIVPMVIRWTDKTISMPEKTTVYIVRQVELLDQFDTNFFDRIQKKHFSWEENEMNAEPAPTADRPRE